MSTPVSLIVGFRPNCSEHERQQVHQTAGAKCLSRVHELHAHLVQVHPKKLRACIACYRKCGQIRYIEHVQGARLIPLKSKAKRSGRKRARVPNDPFFPYQWGLVNTSARKGWKQAKLSCPSTTIAILDTGIDATHPDLYPKVILQKNFSTSDTTDDLFGHGTHVAGIAAAVTNNKRGVAGMSFNSAWLMNVKVLDDFGFGTTYDVARGIIYATNRGAKVINMSLGFPKGSRMLRESVAYAARKGVLLVAAAGNDYGTIAPYPAKYKQVLTVAATNLLDQKADFSNYDAAWVDLAAPGADILSTMPTNPNLIGSTYYGFLSGTSQATPFVSGLAGLIRNTTPDITARQLRRAIEQGTDTTPGTGELYRYGRINAAKAVAIAKRKRHSTQKVS